MNVFCVILLVVVTTLYAKWKRAAREWERAAEMWKQVAEDWKQVAESKSGVYH